MLRTHIVCAIVLASACAEPADELAETGPQGCFGGKCDTAGDRGTSGGRSADTDAGSTDPDSGTSTGQAPAALARFGVRHYDYRFSLLTRHADVSLDLEIFTDGDCVSLPMRTGAPSRVRLGDWDAPPRLRDDALTVCGPPLRAGDRVTLEVADFEVPRRTWGRTQVGYSEQHREASGSFWYAQSWVGECDRLGPCDTSPDTFATYRFVVEHEADVRVLCPGTLEAGLERTTCTFDFDGGPTYSTFSFAASDRWVEHDLGMWGEVHVVLYDLPHARLLDELRPELHGEFLQWMQSTFGPYPYGDELRIFAAPLHWGGFEHPGNIVLDHDLSGDEAVTVLHHEIAHMWAGNQTTLATLHDFVWKESMAEYLPFVFADERPEPTPGARDPESWKHGGLASSFYPVPLEAPGLLDFYGEVYSEGPMVLFRQTEALFGRHAVITALRSLLGEPRALSIDDIREALEASTGTDLRSYFDAWVVGTGIPPRPHFDIHIQNEPGGQATIELRQSDADRTLQGCAFALRLRGPSGQTHEVWLDLGPGGRAFVQRRIEPGFVVQQSDADPYHHCLATTTVSISPL